MFAASISLFWLILCIAVPTLLVVIMAVLTDRAYRHVDWSQMASMSHEDFANWLKEWREQEL